MPAAKTESAEAVRRAFVASVISHSPMFAWACTVGTQGFSPSTDWGRDRGCPARGFGRPVRGRRAPNAGCGNLAAAVNRLALGSVDRGGSLSALGFHGPPAIARDHMLVTALGHFTSPCCRLATLMLPAG